METHRSDYRQWLNYTKKYSNCFELFEKFGVENCVILLLESFQCNSIDELHAKEDEWIIKLQCDNKIVNRRI